MIVHEGKEVIGLVLYFVVNKSHCGKASMIVHEGKEVTGSMQYFVVNESH